MRQILKQVGRLLAEVVVREAILRQLLDNSRQ